MPEYWVYTWLDSRRIRSIDQLKASLDSPEVIDELKRAASLVIDSWRATSPNPKPSSLIAGAGIDLSGRLDCNATECRRAQVERLFRRAWHYFETIVARDAIAEDLVVHRSCPDEEVRERLIPSFETVIMVKELGAESLVEFLPRRPACFEHWKDHAREAGIEDIAAREADIVEQLIPDTRVTLTREQEDVIGIANNPDFSHTQWIHLSEEDIKGKTEEAVKSVVLRSIVRKFLVHLTADANAAKTYGGALGSTLPMFHNLLAKRGDNVANVAFRIELPALEGLSVAQLIDVRFKYQDLFARFRRRLKSFFEQCLAQGITAQDEIQAKLKSDLIDQELEELRSSLKQMEKALKQKSLYALSLGSLIATIGATTGMAMPQVAFGLAATLSAGALAPGVSKYIDDSLKLRSSDLYFLLQAEAHAH